MTRFITNFGDVTLNAGTVLQATIVDWLLEDSDADYLYDDVSGYDSDQGTNWGTRVYAEFAPDSVLDDPDETWVLVTVPSEMPSVEHAIPRHRTIECLVNVVGISADQMAAEQAGSTIYQRFDQVGRNDNRRDNTARRLRNSGVPSGLSVFGWELLSFVGERALRTEPRFDLEIRFYERGWQFRALVQQTQELL